MYITTAHAKGVSSGTLLRVLAYIVQPPTGAYWNFLKSHFGRHVQLYANTETCIDTLLRCLPVREPGMTVVLDKKYARRFTKVVRRFGLKVATFNGQKELKAALEHTPSIVLILIGDAYDSSNKTLHRIYDQHSSLKVVLQVRRRPRSVRLMHDYYLWEPKDLPRSISGCVCVPNGTSLSVAEKMNVLNRQKPRIERSYFIRELWRAVLSDKENRYRRIDKRPPRILARVLYDFYT